LNLLMTLPDISNDISNEAHFHINEDINRQNYCYWVTLNRPLHSSSITVWGAMFIILCSGTFHLWNQRWWRCASHRIFLQNDEGETGKKWQHLVFTDCSN
jgi:hypothetical protein